LNYTINGKEMQFLVVNKAFSFNINCHLFLEMHKIKNFPYPPLGLVSAIIVFSGTTLYMNVIPDILLRRGAVVLQPRGRPP
jgi:hypothetical protein